MATDAAATSVPATTGSGRRSSACAPDNRTVMQALGDGVDSKTVWRAVWTALELPPRER